MTAQPVMVQRAIDLRHVSRRSNRPEINDLNRVSNKKAAWVQAARARVAPFLCSITKFE
jgi:hypothetical protein